MKSQHLFILGFTIIILANIILLSEVAYNRSGEPVSLITLTERELSIPSFKTSFQKENSGIALSLSWRSLTEEGGSNNYYAKRTPIWLDSKKLEELGFDLENLPRYNTKKKNKSILDSKEVFIVLE